MELKTPSRTMRYGSPDIYVNVPKEEGDGWHEDHPVKKGHNDRQAVLAWDCPD